jgi:hypothetical protein
MLLSQEGKVKVFKTNFFLSSQYSKAKSTFNLRETISSMGNIISIKELGGSE